MGIEQKIENILGKLSVILPNLEKYEEIVRGHGERIKGTEEKLISELRNIYVRLKILEDQDRHDTRKGSDRTWNLVTIFISSILSAFIGYVMSR